MGREGVTVLRLPEEMVQPPTERERTERLLSTLTEHLRLGPGPRLAKPGLLTVTLPYVEPEEARAALDQVAPSWAERGIRVSTLV